MSDLGTLIDRYKSAYDDYSAASRAAKILKDDSDVIAQEIEQRMHAENIESASGAMATVTLKKKEVPNLENYEQLAAYVYKHKALHLFNRAINNRAWNDIRAERNGKEIPGVGAFERRTLSKPLKPKGV